MDVLTTKLIIIIIITLLPTIELRGSIPYGILSDGEICPFGLFCIDAGPPVHPLLVFIVAVFANILIIPFIFKFLDWFFHLIEKIKIVEYYVEKTHKKAHPYVEKHGMLGLAIFVAIPLPGTGAYTGALAAHILGMNNKKAMVSVAAGVFCAGVLVLVIATIFKETLGFLIGL